MSFKEQLKILAQRLKIEVTLYKKILKDSRTPYLAKILLGMSVGYLLLPFDLIPDFIPVIGHLDDVIIIPLLIYLALRLIPPEIVEEHRNFSLSL